MSHESYELMGGRVRAERQGKVTRLSSHWKPNDLDELRASMTESVDEIASKVGQIADEIIRLMDGCDRANLVQQIAVHATVGMLGVDDAGPRFGQEARAEYVAGLALRFGDRGEGAASLKTVATVWELVAILFELENRRLFATSIAEGRGDAVAQARWLLRLEQLLDRTTGYPEHLQRMHAAVFEPQREACIHQLGFCPADLHLLCNAIVKLQQDHAEATRRELIASKWSVDRLPGADDLPSELQDILPLFQWAWSISQTIGVSIDAVAEESGLSFEQVVAMLDALSMDWGCQPEFRLPEQANIARRFPSIRLVPQSYFVPLPWAIANELMPWFNALVLHDGLDDEFVRRVRRSRDRGTEALTRAALSGVFGADRVHGPLFYYDDGVRYEVDCVVDLGDGVLVAECKAGGVSDAGRRGAPATVESVADNLLVAAFEQSHRAASYVAGGGRVFENEQGTEVALALPKTPSTLRLAVTFERIDPIAAGAADFAGRSDETPPTWIVCLPDLMIVTDTLMHPSEFVSYAALRAELANDARFFSLMEADLLAGYLEARLLPERGLRESDADAQIVVQYQAGVINNYFTQRAFGESPDRPSTGVPEAAMDALRDLYNRRQPGWVQLSRRVMDQPQRVWGRFRDVMRKARKAARNSKRPVVRQYECDHPPLALFYGVGRGVDAQLPPSSSELLSIVDS
jgi:hypothetical protein